MGQLVEGQWQTDPPKAASDGRFHRAPTRFHGRITADGASGFPAESGRYHLYVSYACPWAHRTLIFRALKGLKDHISVDVVHPHLFDDGWTFDTDWPGATGDRVVGKQFLREIYLEADPDASTRVSVPVLWDRKTGGIVCNESAEIIRMLNSAFDAITGNTRDFYPEALREEIDAINERVYETVNNGVYRCGFARSQEAYDEAVEELFDTLDWLEDRLATRRYLAGDRLTEADWRLFTTLVRFDPVYNTHFKCNVRRIADYPNLWDYTRELYQHPGVRETVRLDHIREHYYRSHESINPRRIVPAGPIVDFDAPHGRGAAAA